MGEPQHDDEADAQEPGHARPAWLTGAEPNEDLEPASASSITALPVPPRAPAPAPQPPRPVPWRAAASGVPTLPSVGDDTEPSAPAGAPIGRPVADEDREDEALFADEEDPLAGPSRYGATAPRTPALPPIKEAWWLVALDTLRSSTRVRVFAGVGVAVAVAAWFAIPRAPSGTPLSKIRRHAAEWDGQRATVHGRVGEVYSVAGGWAFYLHQGRDTIVTFMRSRAPVTGERISVTGDIQTGYLNGTPRQALFEAPEPPKTN